MAIERASLILLCLIVKVYASGCPLPESISPCLCEDEFEVNSHNVNCDGTIGITNNFSDIGDNLRAMTGQPQIYKLRFANLSEPILYDDFFEGLTIHYVVIEDSNIEDISDKAFNGLENSLILLLVMKSNLEKIPVGALKILYVLKGITISNSLLTAVSKAEMDELPSTITYLSLDSNLISSIEMNAFAKLPSLRSLILNDNQLSSFLEPTPTALQYLSLRQNDLTYVPPCAWTMKIGSNIRLDDNMVTSLPNETSIKIILKNDITISFKGNPIKCDCDTKWIPGSPKQMRYRFYGILCADGSGKRTSKNVYDLTQEDYSDC